MDGPSSGAGRSVCSAWVPGRGVRPAGPQAIDPQPTRTAIPISIAGRCNKQTERRCVERGRWSTIGHLYAGVGARDRAITGAMAGGRGGFLDALLRCFAIGDGRRGTRNLAAHLQHSTRRRTYPLRRCATKTSRAGSAAAPLGGRRRRRRRRRGHAHWRRRRRRLLLAERVRERPSEQSSGDHSTSRRGGDLPIYLVALIPIVRHDRSANRSEGGSARSGEDSDAEWAILSQRCTSGHRYSHHYCYQGSDSSHGMVLPFLGRMPPLRNTHRVHQAASLPVSNLATSVHEGFGSSIPVRPQASPHP